VRRLSRLPGVEAPDRRQSILLSVRGPVRAEPARYFRGWLGMAPGEAHNLTSRVRFPDPQFSPGAAEGIVLAHSNARAVVRRQTCPSPSTAIRGPGSETRR